MSAFTSCICSFCLFFTIIIYILNYESDYTNEINRTEFNNTIIYNNTTKEENDVDKMLPTKLFMGFCSISLCLWCSVYLVTFTKNNNQEDQQNNNELRNMNFVEIRNIRTIVDVRSV